jgi:hypothetical protein
MRSRWAPGARSGRGSAGMRPPNPRQTRPFSMRVPPGGVQSDSRVSFRHALSTGVRPERLSWCSETAVRDRGPHHEGVPMTTTKTIPRPRSHRRHHRRDLLHRRRVWLRAGHRGRPAERPRRSARRSARHRERRGRAGGAPQGRLHPRHGQRTARRRRLRGALGRATQVITGHALNHGATLGCERSAVEVKGKGGEPPCPFTFSLVRDVLPSGDGRSSVPSGSLHVIGAAPGLCAGVACRDCCRGAVARRLVMRCRTPPTSRGSSRSCS